MVREYLQKNNTEINYYELTTQQKNILDLQKYHEGTAISNICCAIIYDEIKDMKKLERSIRQVIDRQTALRLRFSNTDPISQYLSEINIDIDIRCFSDESELDAFACKTAEEPMQMYDSPMCSFTLFSLGTRTGIVARLNHLIADAWSFGLLADQIDAFYSGYEEKKNCSGKAILSGDYLSYAQDEHIYRLSERYDKDRRFWEEKYQLRPENCGSG